MRSRPNRYANKRKHKINMKRRYGHGLYTSYRSNIWLHERECREECNSPYARNGGYEYWKTYYLSGNRRYAKYCTNRAIRAYYRDQFRRLNSEDMEDVMAMRNSDYEKAYDYDWTIW